MNKTIKIIAIFLILVMGVVMISNVSYAAKINTDIIEEIDTEAEKDNKEIDDATTDIVGAAGKVVRLIRNVAVIAAVILVTVLGVKYMLGSAEEKSDYKKSFLPLIIGAVIVVTATQIATMLFSIM